MNRLTILLLLTLTTATLAQAQPEEALSPHEVEYVSRLAHDFGCLEPGVESLALPWRRATADGSAPADARSTARGLHVVLGAVQVYRFKLEDAPTALDFAARHQVPGRGPVVSEVCGTEVLFVQGQPLRDAHRAGNILDRAWGMRPAAPSATVARLSDDELILVAHERNAGAVAARIQDLFKVAASHPEAATRHAGDEVSVVMPNGLTHHARLNTKGGWRLQAADAERGKALRSYARHLTGRDMSCAAPTPVDTTTTTTRGVASVLNGALGR